MIVGVVIAMRLRPGRPILVATLAMFAGALPYLPSARALHCGHS